MGILFPIISILALASVFYHRWGIVLLREAFLSAIVVLGLFAVISIEILGSFRALTPTVVRSLWILTALSLGLGGLHTWRRRSPSFSSPKAPLFSLTPFERTCVFILLGIFAITAFIAFVAPPNNWDSMTYHLARIMHWAEQRSVSNFPTDIPRQNQYPPGAEYILLHIFLLTSNDRWFNFLQWSALAGSCLGVSLIAQELGAGRCGQLLTAVVASTVPMAILQSTSTQTDLIETFWLVTAITFALRCRKNWSWFSFLISSVAFAIGVLTKGTFFVAIPVLVWASAGYHIRWKGKIILAILFIGILACVIGGFCLRENALNGKASKEFIVDSASFSSLAFNALHHASVHWILPWKQDFPGRSEILLGAHSLFKKDASDLEGIIVNPTGVKPAVMALDEDYAGNCVHFFLYLICLLSLIFCPKNKNIQKFAFLVTLGGTFFIFFKWQEFISRMHLPVFILFAPVVATLLEKKRILRAAVICLLAGSGAFFLFNNQTRPLIGPARLMQVPRNYYYFMKKPFYNAYEQASEIISSSQCTDVGLIEREDSWEYPLWAFTGFGSVRFHSINAKIKGAPPCLIIKVDTPREDLVTAEGSSYVKIWEGFPLQIFAHSKYK